MQEKLPESKRNAPGHHTEGASKNFNSMDTSLLRSADVALRCAWLRVHADLLLDYDTSGQLTANLYDFAHLLEATQRQGWFK